MADGESWREKGRLVFLPSITAANFLASLSLTDTDQHDPIMGCDEYPGLPPSTEKDDGISLISVLGFPFQAMPKLIVAS